MPTVHLLDYGAGNVRSVRNAITRGGFDIVDIQRPEQIADAQVLVFPGVGAFGCAMDFLDIGGFRKPLLAHIASGKPYMGICLGLQTLFESSEETPGVAGLGVIPGSVTRFPASPDYSVPQIGWNGINVHKASPALTGIAADAKVYFVHSYRATVSRENAGWVLTTTDYGGCRYISSVAKGNVFATQFHPEKSGPVGLAMLKAFLTYATSVAAVPVAVEAGAGAAAAAAAAAASASSATSAPSSSEAGEGEGEGESYDQIMSTAIHKSTRIARRIVACLDVRTNDDGDLVVTKGDKYDVREKADGAGAGAGADCDGDGAAAEGGAAATATARPVRNLGKPVDLSARYYAEGADEVAFLNITAFRSEPLEDTPMLAVLEAASEKVFVPLTIGGGIRSYTDSRGVTYTALDVASRYFRAGADKISIGSDAVAAAEAWYAAGKRADGSSAIEAIAKVYGVQAVVVSVDPRRVYVAAPDDAECAARGNVVIKTAKPGPNGEGYCWYQCTVKGGREGRPLCAVSLGRAVQALGAGELLVNCVDNDGQKAGFDEELMSAMCAAVSIPVIASSGAGEPAHFSSVFAHTRCEAALAAGIFHRREVSIAQVKEHLIAVGVETRPVVTE